MAGGTWTSQTKVRPGAYINFKAVPKGSLTVGDRGIVAMGLPLSWGANGSLIEVLSADLLNGNSMKLVGFTANDSASKLLASALKYCYKALVFRTDVGGSKAAVTPTGTGLICTAKYAGTLGNSLSIAITVNSGIYTIISYLNGAIVDQQKVATIGEIVSNDYIDFSQVGSTESNYGVLVATTATLAGGTNGTVTESSAYTAMFALLEVAKWQTFASFSVTSGTLANVVTFIERLRNDEGRYVQAVVANYDSANTEGIINVVNGATINNVVFTAAEMCSIVAGMTAGADINQSNTARVIEGATAISGALTDEQIKAALSAGKFVLSSSTSGNVKVEQDINSLHNYPADKNYAFTKNRVIRTLDEIGTSIKQTWEDVYMGKVNNNETGRALFRADIVQYMFELQRLNAIQNFAVEDVEVSQGTELDAVVVDLAVMPVDSMEKLYMTVNVNS